MEELIKYCKICERIATDPLILQDASGEMEYYCKGCIHKLCQSFWASKIGLQRIREARTGIIEGNNDDKKNINTQDT